MPSKHSMLPVPSLEEAHAALDYNPETGAFRWKDRPDIRPSANARFVGKLAGHRWCYNPSAAEKDRRYYLVIRLNGRTFLAHRLAWFMMTGEWPLHEIDHRDGDGLNNRWKNLRPATRPENNANSRRSKRNTIGHKGVSVTKDGRFRARIYYGGKQHHLGVFDTPEEAHEAWWAVKRTLHPDYARAS